MRSHGTILWLGQCGDSGLAEVGGKAANLDVLLAAGFSVPRGFVVTTDAYADAAERCGAGALVNRLASLSAPEPEAVCELARSIRSTLQNADLGEALTAEIAVAYAELDGEAVVAVRSSATAEDLAQASFAGQQDTFLDIHGLTSVLQSVRSCWASLWTDRAVMYRARAGVDHRTVRLAAIVQRMIQARVAGVMFTADPISGCRQRAVIDAVRGLGEAVVSGHHDADHYVVDLRSGRLLSQRRAGAEPENGTGSLDTKGLSELVQAGQLIERRFGAPQDVEFAFDPKGRLWITQTRAITTLFPLPSEPPDPNRGLRVYFSSTADEGVVRPITPMGLQAFRLMVGAWAELFWGVSSTDPLAGPAFVVEAGMRTFYDVTPLVRSATGRRLARRFIAAFDAHTAAILDHLFHNPELAPRRDSAWRPVRLVLRPLWRFPFVSGILGSLVAPDRARTHRRRVLPALLARTRPDATDPPNVLLAKATQLIWEGAKAIPRIALHEPAAGFVAFVLAKAALGRGAVGETEAQVLLSGVDNSPTVRMNLDLWGLSETLRTDEASHRALTSSGLESLRDAFHAGRLPPALAAGLARFLAKHGHRAVFEVDLGLPRWSEDPTHVLGSLQNYLRQGASGPDPTALHARAAEAAAVTERAALRRVGPLRRAVARFLIGRARALWGYREQWKDDLSRIWAAARELLRPLGEGLAAQGRLEEPSDIFFLDLREVGALLNGADEDWRQRVRARREIYEVELKRRRVPAVLLSDGTDASISEPSEVPASGVVGIGASPGVARGRARVLLDPVGAAVEPGEILVAPSTDPGWTPLFMTAAGLVMEKGAPMCHGAVVAREFGIPAVVGVADATSLIRTGQMLEIDGAAGRVTLVSEQREIGVK